MEIGADRLLERGAAAGGGGAAAPRGPMGPMGPLGPLFPLRTGGRDSGRLIAPKALGRRKRSKKIE